MLKIKFISKFGQSSIEFLVLITGIVFFFLVFIYAVYDNITKETIDQLYVEVEEVARIVQDEVNLASKASDGYSRNFVIPDKVANRDYEINITSNSVYIRTNDGKFASALSVLNVTGVLKKGDNLIRKEDGLIYLNE